MLKTVWLSYDLGVKGDYSNLYRWLDDAKAVECGDSLAYFRLEVPDTDALSDFIKKELEANVTFAKTDRIYIIWKTKEGSNKGRFIVGKRKASPWQGQGSSGPAEDDL